MASATARQHKRNRIDHVGKISRWGNSLGLRIPREGVQKLALKDGSEVTVEIGDDQILIRPARRRKRWTEAQLLRNVTPDIVGGEVNWGGPVGREAI
jgi:antitoxin MazE